MHLHQILVTADTRVTDFRLTGFNHLLFIALRRTVKKERAFVTCILCQQHEIEVGNSIVNGRLPIANGVCADEKDRLKCLLITYNHVRLYGT